jgi:hypothetical protein
VGESKKGLSKSPFLAINAKGGENIKPKVKGPHHHHFKIFEIKDLISIHKSLVFNWYLVIAIYSIRMLISIGIFKERFSKFVSKLRTYFQLVSITKTLLKTKRRISFRGSFV